jgi:hypothetical protein
LTTIRGTIWVYLPSGLIAEDVAFFIERVIERVQKLPEVTLGGILKEITAYARIVAFTHFPHLAVAGLSKAAEENAMIFAYV